LTGIPSEDHASRADPARHGRQGHHPRGSQLFFDTAESKDKTLKMYDGMCHDLLNDVDKEVVMSDITRWIDGRLPKR
jgi:alpha-beta hydrolase superfamily lysophospholipase